MPSASTSSIAERTEAGAPALSPPLSPSTSTDAYVRANGTGRQWRQKVRPASLGVGAVIIAGG